MRHWWSIEVGLLDVAGHCFGSPSADELYGLLVVAQSCQELGARHSAYVFMESLSQGAAGIGPGKDSSGESDDLAEELDDVCLGDGLSVWSGEQWVVARWSASQVSM